MTKLIQILALIGLVMNPTSTYAQSEGAEIKRSAIDRTVPKLECRHGIGTGFWLGNKLVTVSHIWSARRCLVNATVGLTAEINDPATDFALLSQKEEKPSLELACEPLRKGEIYTGLGYHQGRMTIVRAKITGQVITKKEFPNFGQIGYGTNVFVGLNGEQFLDGMSGGPVLNSRGQVVAIIIGYDENGKGSFARAVVNTPLCEASDKSA